MIKRRARRIVMVGFAVAVAAMASSLPAGAQPPSNWPTNGYFPTGCGNVTLNPSSVTYTETTVPALQSVEFTVNGARAGRTLVVGPLGRTGVGVVGRVTSHCSGIGPSWATPAYAAGFLYLRSRVGVATLPELIPLTHSGPVNSFDDVFGGPYFSLGSSAPTIPGGLGAQIQPLFWGSVGRYQSFDLNLDGQLIASTETTGADIRYVSASNLPTLQVLRQSVLSVSSSARRVPAGRTVTLSGVLRAAGSRVWSPVAGRVVLQRKVGGGPWTSIATAHSSARGLVGFSLVVTRSASYRLVYSGNASAGIDATAPSVTPAVTVRTA